MSTLQVSTISPTAPGGAIDFVADQPPTFNGAAVGFGRRERNDIITSAYTLQASDLGKVLVVNSLVTVTITIPNTARPAGFGCDIFNEGTGALFVVAGSGVTLTGSSLSSLPTNSAVTLYEKTTNSFVGTAGSSILQSLIAGTAVGQGIGVVGATPGAGYPAGTAGAWLNTLQGQVSALSLPGSSGVLGYTTKALMDADLAHPAGTVAYVLNDPVLTNNTLFLKSGISGSGSWGISGPTRIDSIDTRLTDNEMASPFMPGVLASMRSVRRLSLYGANPAKFYSVRYFFRNDVGTRFNFTVSEATDAAGTGAIDVALFSSSGINYSGQVEFSLAASGGSGITGTLVVDFTTAASTWAIYRGSGGATFANLGIRNDVIETSAASTAASSAATATAITTGISLIPGKNIPFVDNLSNDFLRRFIKSIYVYGADTSHVYILNLVEVTLTRRTVALHDLTAGLDVCRWRITATVTDYSAQPRFVKLVWQGPPLAYSGVYAVAELDWSQAVTGTYAYTTAVQSGVHLDRLRSDEMVHDYLDRDVWHEVIKVGAGQTYTTLRAAVESLYDSVSVTTCARACYDHQILIDLVDAATYNASFLNIPEYVGVRGVGMDKTYVQKESDVNDAMFEAHYETKFSDLTIISDTGDGGSWQGEYCIHSDDFNRLSKADTPNRRLRQTFKRLKLIGGNNQHVPLFGCGISSGEEIRFTDVEVVHKKMDSTTAGFVFHNTGISPSSRPCLLEFYGCKSADLGSPGLTILSIGGGNRCRVTLVGSDLGLIAQGVTGSIADKAADRYEWEIGGVYDGPVVQSDAGMVVLKTAAGATPTGTAAAIVFGAVDELGQGELCIEGGTSKSLGARLGDCSTVTKTLTISGQTWTANANYTAQSNATIIAAMNVSLTTSPVSEKNIQWQVYPDTGFVRRVLNSTGSTIAANRFVKLTGTNTIALATGDDDIYGITYRDILNGLGGNVIVGRRVHRNYIDSTAADGKFGVTAGVIDFGASIKKGVIQNSVARLY